LLRGILFDLDDTLYEYAPCNEAGLAAAYEVAGKGPWDSPEGFRRAHDSVRQELARELAGHAASHDRILFFKRMIERAAGAPDPDRTLSMYTAYWERFLETMRPAPRAHEVLAELCASRPLALVSNHTTRAQLRKITRLGLAPYFRGIVTSEDAGAEKPDPRPFERALESLGIPASEAVMIGDDPRSDLEGARACGLKTLWVRTFRSEPAAECDGAVDELAELPGHPLLTAEKPPADRR